MQKDICVIGGGSWGTALVKILTDNGYGVNWWVHRPETAEHIRKHHHNPKYLSSVFLEPGAVNVDTDLKNLIEEVPVLLFALPSSFLTDTLDNEKISDIEKKVCISAIKGIITRHDCLVSEYLGSELKVPEDNLVGLGGPCHAEEVADEKQSYLTFACSGKNNLKRIASMFDCRYIQTNTCEDLPGFEYASVLKNVYAITAGICHGLGYGDNFQAVLVSNAMREMHAFIEKAVPGKRNVLDTAYLGDLLVTAYSQHSRNRTFGNMIGHGYSVKSAQLEMNMIAEGYFALKTLNKIREKHSHDAPILDCTYQILYQNQPAGTLIHKLSKTFT